MIAARAITPEGDADEPVELRHPASLESILRDLCDHVIDVPEAARRIRQLASRQGCLAGGDL